MLQEKLTPPVCHSVLVYLPLRLLSGGLNRCDPEAALLFLQFSWIRDQISHTCIRIHAQQYNETE